MSPSRVVPFRLPPGASEWVAARYVLPYAVREERGAFRPITVLWLALPDDVLLLVKLLDPEEGVSFADTFQEAMQSEYAAMVRPPTRIRVPDRKLAAELRRVAGKGIDIVVAPVPELDAIFADLSEEGEKDGELPYLPEDVEPEAARDLFAAAARLYSAAPWQHVTDREPFLISIPAAGVQYACLVVMGAAREKFGIVLYRSFRDYLEFPSRFAARPRGIEAQAGHLSVDDPMFISLTFGGKSSLTETMRREADQYRWPVAGPAAYPIYFAMTDEMVSSLLNTLQFRIMTVCAEALAKRFTDHRPASGPEWVMESSHAGWDFQLHGPLIDDVSVNPPRRRGSSKRRKPRGR